ncbi:MAG: hypothetical protein KGJ57_12985 [Sphingomonadales bacterium]|nr:hypothetical protein [Sphingomonadales bacterium]MDE2170327.1 hypothetical protein [Sphingomonadales bacterium]
MIRNKAGNRSFRAAGLCAQVSFAALVAAIPVQAWAQCSPDPSQSGTSTTCSGSDSNGYTISTSLSPLTVGTGASVTNSGAAAILVSIPASGPYSGRSAAITVNGAVSATGAAGIAVTSGPLGSASYDYYGTNASITVGAGATVSGTYGISATQTLGNFYGPATIFLDNSGSITGLSGVALYSSGNYATFSQITNRASGTIGAIQANGSINNAGTIDGGALSAIAPGAGASTYYGSISNSGTITSSSAAGTIANYNSTITNSGTISNIGSGAAINNSYLSLTNQKGGTISAGGSSVLTTTGSASITNAGTITNTGNGAVLSLPSGSLAVTNNAGGVISTQAGNTVLASGGSLNLVNSGAITGNIVTGSGNSSIDSSAGTITGNVTFGSGNDTLIATLKDGSLSTGISGSINGGAGTNMVQLKTTADATLSSALSLPTNFSVLDLAPAFGTTLTLANGYPVTTTINFDGAGTLVNAGTINRSGQILTQLNGYSSGGTFRNDGSIITANPGTAAAVSMVLGSINNTGSISATGNAVQLQSGNYFTNSGTITAGGTAASVYVNGSFANTGTIRSTGGMGLSLMFTCNCSAGTNSGTIAGATTGLSLSSGTLVNTGMIFASGTGVVLGSYGTIDNRAGGVISGGSLAINGANQFAIGVFNAGTINGNVNIANTYSFVFGNGNTYLALPGGMLNGNLTLGNGDKLVTSLTGAGTSGYAGINGTVTANNSLLRYDVTTDASDTFANRAGFSSVGYQVGSGATLTLGTNGTVTTPLSLAGTGNVVFNGSVLVTNAAALSTTSVIQSSGTVPTTALTITNNGTLTSTRNSTLGNSGTVTLPAGYGSTGPTGSTLINNGTVSFTDTTGSTSSYAAVSGYNVVNSGTIRATGGNGVSATTLTNAGIITATGDGVQLGGSSVTNSGSITSTTGAAIRSLNYYGTGDSVMNLSGGTLTGVGTAVQMAGGVLSNAGTIKGNVNLGYSPYAGASYASGAFVASGGTLSGNLSFGSGNDVLVETGSGYGVTGTIDGGGGTNLIGHQRSGTATVTLGGGLLTGFTGEFTVAAGAASQVTIKAPSAYTGDIYVSGDGSIVNQLATTGIVAGLSYAGNNYAPYNNVELGSFSNQANVGGVTLNTANFSNSATIGSSSLAGTAVSLSTNNGLNFSNSGSILSNGLSSAVSLTAFGSANNTVVNSGTISGVLAATIYSSYSASGSGDLSITNSGTINGATVPVYGPAYSVFAVNYSGGAVSLANSGTINGGSYLSGSSTTFTNSGTINGGTPSAYGPYATIYAVSGSQGVASLSNSGTIKGSISLSGASTVLTNTGTIIGDIATSASGSSTFAMNGAFAGSILASGGANTLTIGGGTQSAPVAFTNVSGIGSLSQSSGFATLSGMGMFDTVALTGGRLVGFAGSTLTAKSFTVGSGATFGSAGTVNGNVSVNGILSPGASPGTMTVNGNVTLASGSTSLFEITPTVSDKLNVAGKVTILPGSTLQIAASAPVKVGSTLDLISATGGVSGSYDTLTGLTGTLRPLANGDLGLLVQFANPDSYTPQVRRAIAYVNTAMAASTAPAALFPALSSLQDGNAAPIASAFARITPEPYADAMQIGTETALSLAGNARTIGESEARGDTHLFAFGQMLGSLRQFASNEEQGVSHATVNGFGALGGLGVGGDGYAVSAYVGWMDQRQSIGALDASTQARGVVGGVAARFGGVTRITLSAAYDNAHALTRRNVPDAGLISTAYSLPSWSFDASISRALPLGGGWVARPQVGTTWVMTSHDAMTEVSAHPFALNVAAANQTQGFVDAGLGFETAADAGGRWHRFLTLGLRYRAEGYQSAAVAALAGSTPDLMALGVGRDRLDATLAAGVNYQLAPGASFFLSGSGELGKATKRESVTAGLRFRL